MARGLTSHLDFNGNQAQNARIHNLAAAPTSKGVGHVYYDTVKDAMYVASARPAPAIWRPMTPNAMSLYDIPDSLEVVRDVVRSHALAIRDSDTILATSNEDEGYTQLDLKLPAIYAQNVVDFNAQVNEAVSANAYAFIDSPTITWTKSDDDGTMQPNVVPRRLFTSYTDSTAWASNTNEQDLGTGTGLGTRRIPEYPVQGRNFRVWACGQMTHAAVAANLTMRLRMDTTAGTAYITIGPYALGATAWTSKYWEFEAYLTIRTEGATGTALSRGVFRFHNGATYSNTQGLIVWSETTLTAAQTYDNRIPHIPILTGQFSVAAGNSMTCETFILDETE